MTEKIEVTIEKLVYGGEGLAHHEGRTVFVPFVLPGEVVSVAPGEQKKKFIRGRVAEIVQPSPRRVAAPCPYFARCGGCDYQHIAYEDQLQFKAEILRETLSRLGRVVWDGPIASHPSAPYGYRNRAQWKIGQDASGAPALGYFERGSQKLCAIDHCPICSPLLEKTIAALVRLLAAGKLPAGLREVEAFADHDDAKLLLNLSFERWTGVTEDLATTLRGELPGIESVLVHSTRDDRFDLAGPGYLTYRVADTDYRVGHLSFFQVNRFLPEELVAAVLGEARGKLALDLYAGVGLFTVPLADRFQRVIGVESNEAAARDLAINLQGRSSSTSVRHANVEAFVAQWRDFPDFVVIDPPRAGVPEPTLQRVAKLSPREIAYLSCDPATLARDLAVLVGTAEKPGAYLISQVHVVDIFPQTYHMEALVRLVRRA